MSFLGPSLFLSTIEIGMKRRALGKSVKRGKTSVSFFSTLSSFLGRFSSICGEELLSRDEDKERKQRHLIEEDHPLGCKYENLLVLSF